MRSKISVLLLVGVLLASMLLCSCGDKDDDEHDPFDFFGAQETTEPETQAPETDAPLPDENAPVDAAEVQSMIAEKIAVDEERLTFAGADYFEYNENTYILDYEYTVEDKFAPIVAVMNVKVYYSFDTASEEWNYSYFAETLKRFDNVEYVLGEWENDDGYYLNIIEIDAKNITYEYNFDGVSGTATSMYSVTLDGLGMVCDKVKLSVISPDGADELCFYSDGLYMLGWYVDGYMYLERLVEKEPEPEEQYSDRVQRVINILKKDEAKYSFYYDSFELQYERDLSNNSYEVCVHATATEMCAPLSAVYQFTYQGGDFGSRVTKELVYFKDNSIMEGKWAYKSGDVSVEIEIFNLGAGTLDSIYEINGVSAEKAFLIKRINRWLDEEVPYLGVELENKIEGYTLGYYVNYHDPDSAGWYLDREIKLEKIG